MGKLRAGLFSMAASGTIADTLCFDKRSGLQRVRRKPVPTDRKTLLQLYHRWDYLHYCFEWQKLTNAQKQTWESNARRLRITGFNYFMRDRLTNLPDLVGRWRLDQLEPAQAYDSSPNAKHGTIYGATPVPGRIDYGLWADGTDDYVDLGNHAVHKPTDEMTIMCFFRSFHTQVDYAYLVSKRCMSITTQAGGQFIYARMETEVGTWTTPINEVALEHGVTKHLALTFHKDIGAQIFLDGVLTSESLGVKGELVHTNNGFNLFRNPWGVTKYRWHGLLDDFLFYDVVLSDADIKAHSERSYPIP